MTAEAIRERVLTDDLVEAIQALFPRYPTRQAVTLPALHLVNERLRYVPLSAVVEIADLLGLELPSDGELPPARSRPLPESPAPPAE